jgi:hypothetical protein
MEFERPEIRLRYYDLAKSFGVPLSVLTRAIKGETKPNKKNLHKMSSAMGHTSDEYFINEID